MTRIRFGRLGGALALVTVNTISCRGEVIQDAFRRAFEGDSVAVPQSDATPPAAFLVILGPPPIRTVDAASGPVTVTITRPTDRISVLAVADDPQGAQEVHLELGGSFYCQAGGVGSTASIDFAPQAIVRDQRPGERTTTRLSLLYDGALTTACASGYALVSSSLGMSVSGVNFAGVEVRSPSVTFTYRR